MTDMTRIVDGQRVITLDELALQAAQIENLERDKAELEQTIVELREDTARLDWPDIGDAITDELTGEAQACREQAAEPPVRGR